MNMSIKSYIDFDNICKNLKLLKVYIGYFKSRVLIESFYFSSLGIRWFNKNLQLAQNALNLSGSKGLPQSTRFY